MAGGAVTTHAWPARRLHLADRPAPRCRDEAAKTMRSSYALAISARSRQLAAGRTAGGGYANHGERMYVEGVLEQRRKEQLVGHCCA
jgi:hypothetical protein